MALALATGCRNSKDVSGAAHRRQRDGVSAAMLDAGELDASSDADASDETLCTPERDPHEALCGDPDAVTSLEAFAIVRTMVPDGAILIWLFSASLLDLDGRSEQWVFQFVDLSSAERIEIAWRSGEAMVDERSANADCDAASAIRVLDSRSVVHDAVHRFERARGVPLDVAVDQLFLDQQGCDGVLPESHDVMLRHMPNPMRPEATRYFFARYWDDGRFIELAGPCVRQELTNCLAGD